MNKRDVFIGMDLGTTNSTCAITYSDMNREVINVDGESHLLCSIVKYNSNDDPCVGKNAFVASALREGNVCTNMKRIIGRKFSDRIVKDLMNSCNAMVVEDEKGYAAFKIPAASNSIISVERVCSEVVKKMWEIACKKVEGNIIRSLTITIPAMFSQDQRLATLHAVEKAGINCKITMVSEPSAAAIAFGIQDSVEDGNILIYDLGGGTFDVSIVHISSGNIFDIIATDGENTIGGVLFDELILKEIRSQYNSLTGGKNVLPEQRTSDNEFEFYKSYSKLMDVCRIAKENISSSDYFDIDLTSISHRNGDDSDCDDVEIKLTRAVFEELISPSINTTIRKVLSCIEKAGLSVSAISKVVLVGGSSRIPYVEKRLASEFGASKIVKGINPDECVALGASVFGFKKGTLQDTTILEKTKLAIAIKSSYGLVDIIPVGKQIPCSGYYDFSVSSDNIGFFRAPVYEIDKREADSNRLLRNIVVTTDEIYERQANLRFFYSVNVEGLITLRVVDKDTEVTYIEETIVD